MCSNYRPVTRADHLLTFFGVERDKDQVSADLWPTGMAPFIRLAEPGSKSMFTVDDGLFGLLPEFAVEVAQGRKTYNARSETVARLPSFRESWRKGWRCIIPAEAIYEPNWESGKCERWIIMQPGGVPMGLAGIYRKWRHPDGRDVFTFAMLTINADGHALMSRFHRPQDEKRMVVILRPQDYGAWLSCPVEQAPQFLTQWPGPLEAMSRPPPARVPVSIRARNRPAPGPSDGQLF